MHLPRRRNAFILPFVLLLATTVLSLSLLTYRQARTVWEMEQVRSLHLRARQTAGHLVPVLLDQLSAALAQGGATSALIPESEGVSATALLDRSGSGTLLTLSGMEDDSRGSVTFQSPVSPTRFRAGLIQWSPENAADSVQVAWVIEDIALNPDLLSAPSWWPLPDWMLRPHDPEASQGTIMDLPRAEIIPADEPIPFLPDRSPAFTPVITHAGLRFGIFASGTVGSREKVIRIRYYVDCGLWNPYNRPLLLHGGSGRRPVFRVRFDHLPEVRLHNRSMGISTGWINLDQAINSQTGEAGIEAWIQAPSQLGPGESLNLSEPDPRWQPEGLARTVQPAFMVGPADSIEVEFRTGMLGIRARFMAMDSGPEEEGWFLAEAIPLPAQSLQFDRADESQRPFYLTGGSLSFRPDNTHQQILLERVPDHLTGTIDPRQSSLVPGQPVVSADGKQIPVEEIIYLRIQNLLQESGISPRQVSLPALFSWPGLPEDSLLDQSDLPAWENGFRIGSTGASILNSHLASHWPFGSQPVVEHLLRDGRAAGYEWALPVNTRDAKAWLGVLSGSGFPDPATGRLGFARYPSPSGIPDYQWLEPARLVPVGAELARLAGYQPARSVGDFFTRGHLATSFRNAGIEDPLHHLLPLRGWLRDAPPLVRHGSAWILHLAVVFQRGSLSLQKGLWVWLLQVPDNTGYPVMEPIRWQWIDPNDPRIPIFN
jgi:hypothetical protein